MLLFNYFYFLGLVIYLDIYLFSVFLLRTPARKAHTLTLAYLLTLLVIFGTGRRHPAAGAESGASIVHWQVVPSSV